MTNFFFVILLFKFSLCFAQENKDLKLVSFLVKPYFAGQHAPSPLLQEIEEKTWTSLTPLALKDTPPHAITQSPPLPKKNLYYRIFKGPFTQQEIDALMILRKYYPSFLTNNDDLHKFSCTEFCEKIIDIYQEVTINIFKQNNLDEYVTFQEMIEFEEINNANKDVDVSLSLSHEAREKITHNLKKYIDSIDFKISR